MNLSPLPVNWTAPQNVAAFQTILAGGNLATHVGDDPLKVADNRHLLTEFGVPSPVRWLTQIHSNVVHDFDQEDIELPHADGAVTERAGVCLAVLTADCLPVLAYSRQTGRVGVFHGGWRGLAAGIIHNGIKALGGAASDQDWWIGPGIGPKVYTVGPEVREAFLAQNPDHEHDFIPHPQNSFSLDLAAVARRQLRLHGVAKITTALWTTDQNPELFWSYRRDSKCGRTAALIWKIPTP